MKTVFIGFVFLSSVFVEAKTSTVHLNMKHQICKEDSDCEIAHSNCCTGIAINKKYLKKYHFKYDEAKCALVRCAALTAVCQDNLCTENPPQH